jgi:hypothetical protein
MKKARTSSRREDVAVVMRDSQLEIKINDVALAVINFRDALDHAP